MRRAMSIVFALVLVGLGCDQKSTPAPAAKTSESSKSGQIAIGAVLPLTGAHASYGKAAQRGTDLAFEEINAHGGVNGNNLTVVYEDDEGQASKAVAAMQKLVSVNKVPLVIGSADSSVTLSICPIANREQVLLISNASSSPELTKKGGPYFFRVCPSDLIQAGQMAEWFWEDHHRRAAVIYVNNSWGRPLMDEFSSRFQSLGGTVVAAEACNKNDRDLRTQLSKVMAASPDALYAITYGREGGTLLRQAKELAFSKRIYGADPWITPELVESAGETAKGVPILAASKLAGPGYERFAKSFKAKYGQEPDVYAGYAYDMAQIISKALSVAQSGEPLRKALAASELQGVTGPVKFDEHGDVVGKGFQRIVLP